MSKANVKIAQRCAEGWKRNGVTKLEVQPIDAATNRQTVYVYGASPDRGWMSASPETIALAVRLAREVGIPVEGA